MAANRGSEAYDLSLFEERPAKVVPLKPNKKMQKAQERKNAMQSLLNTLATLLVAASVIAVMGIMITSRVRLTEMDSIISQKQQQLVVLQSENTRLTDELASKTSIKSVEEYASNTLGMQKIEPSQIEYIQAASGDKTVLSDQRNESVLEAAGRAISKFFTQVAYLFR